MRNWMMSRRRLLGLASVSAAGAGLSVFLPAPARAWSWFGPRDLSREVEAYRRSWALSRLPEAQCGSWVTGKPPGPLCEYALRATRIMRTDAGHPGCGISGRPPGPDFVRARDAALAASEALFSTPARCADDVLRKYAMLEEYYCRAFKDMMKRKSQPDPHADWYAQLDADMERFGVDINPWWRDGARCGMMVDGRDVSWWSGSFKRRYKLFSRI